MALPVLPQDVFDEIISQLTGETSTLKSCSLVCRSFRRNAQKMLFNYTVVRLTYDDSDDYTYDTEIIGACQPLILVLIVKHAPHLIEYIQELTISCFGVPYYEFDASDTTDLANALGVFSHKGEFPVNLRSLSFRLHALWNRMDPCLERALLLLMSTCSLRHIFLAGILDCPAKLFQNLPPLLKHLSLTQTTFSSLPTTRKELPKLESLTICFLWGTHASIFDQFSNDVERIVNTTQLKNFEGGDCTPSTLPGIERILRPTFNSLEHLILREFNIADPDSVSVNLNRFPRLTGITIYQRSTTRIPTMLILITRTMKNISHRNVIQNLLFHLDLSDINIVDFESATKDVWQEVDTICSIPQLAPSNSFHGITFSIRSTACYYDAFSDLIQNKLPETKKASKLHIKTSKPPFR